MRAPGFVGLCSGKSLLIGESNTCARALSRFNTKETPSPPLLPSQMSYALYDTIPQPAASKVQLKDSIFARFYHRNFPLGY